MTAERNAVLVRVRIDEERGSPTPVDHLDDSTELTGLLVYLELVQDHGTRLPVTAVEQKWNQRASLGDLRRRQAEEIEDGREEVDH